MNTHYPEERLALYIEGDLPAHDQAEFDAHLLSCATCRKATEELRSHQVLIKSLRADSVNASVLLRVRENVLSQMSRTERAPGWWRSFERMLFTGGRLRYAFASAVLIAIAGVVLALMRTSGPVPVEESVAVIPAPAPRASTSIAPEPPKKPEPPRRRELQQQSPVKPAVASQPVMVNLFTDDPNIVIYWFFDSKGDME